ncbi:MAG: hypothetical protein N2235_14580 [Fischerella sp.]|nr:hypothetical protein [Fischerella sp.]
MPPARVNAKGRRVLVLKFRHEITIAFTGCEFKKCDRHCQVWRSPVFYPTFAA